MSNTIESIEQGNLLIADFMKTDAVNSPHLKAASELKYHSAWKYLGPVIDKIYRIKEKNEVNWRKLNDDKNICAISFFATIEQVWQTVVKFIEWYNTQKSNQ